MPHTSQTAPSHPIHFSPLRIGIIWLCASSFYFYQMILRVAPAIMTDHLMQDFAITATAVGVLASCYHWAYSLLQIPCGIIVDRLGVRRVLTVSALLCASGGFLFASTQSYSVALLGQFLIGSGSACAFLSSLKVAADWFSPKRFALLSGLTNLMGTLGATFGGRPLALLLKTHGWRSALSIIALIGFGMALLAWVIIRDHPKPAHTPADETMTPLFSGIKFLIKVPQIWFIGIVGGLTYVPIASFAGLWAVPFLMQTFGIDTPLASTANIMIFIGFGLGGPLFILFSNFIQRRILTIWLTTFVTIFIFLAIIFIPHIPLKAMFALFFAAGLFTGGRVLCFTCAKETAPLGISATTIGFTNMLVTLTSAVLLQPILGHLLDWAWDGQLQITGIPAYSRQAFQIALSSIPICLVISLVLLFFVKETFPKDADKAPD